MTRKAIVNDLLADIEPHLEPRLEAWEAQPRQIRQPTLPTTLDGKVNVAGMVRELALQTADARHFFRKPAIRDAVNVADKSMGLAPIGSRSVEEASGEAVTEKLIELRKSGKRARESLVEALKHIDLLKAQNESLRLRLAQMEARMQSKYESGDIQRCWVTCETSKKISNLTRKVKIR